jgi:hypothetical protein
MRVGEIRQFCKLQEAEQHLMRGAMTQLNLSARAYHRMRSVKLAHDRGFSGMRKNPVCAFGGGITIQTEVDDGVGVVVWII